jgi:enoyl-CoA hydratase/carnithine racemase
MSEKILTEINNGVGVITLNAPKALNSLDTDMCKGIAQALESWRANDQVQCVVLKSVGEKAFCAGGDVVSLYKSMKDGGEYHKDFFIHEYKTDLMIHQYKKPIVVLAKGIVMGGGIGIMNGASHRIVTESTKLAMPEITIGLFPDVGGSFFLNQMPGQAGLYLGLTGTRFNGADAIFTNMADYFLLDEKLDELLDHFYQFEWTGDTHQDVTEIVEHFSHQCKEDIGVSEVEQHLDQINRLCQASSISEIKANFDNYLAQDEDEQDKWFTRGMKSFLAGSPTSMAVIFEQIKRGEGLSIEEVFAVEGKMAQNFGKGHDFAEGVRALLIDKDGSPNWSPASLDEVSAELVNSHFE